eukprot:SAG31_NODE_2998_length_4801_cov_3.226074_5_plen_74_part_00
MVRVPPMKVPALPQARVLVLCTLIPRHILHHQYSPNGIVKQIIETKSSKSECNLALVSLYLGAAIRLAWPVRV